MHFTASFSVKEPFLTIRKGSLEPWLPYVVLKPCINHNIQDGLLKSVGNSCMHKSLPMWISSVKQESLFMTWGWENDILQPTLRYQSFLCFLLPFLFCSQIKPNGSTASEAQTGRESHLCYQSMTDIICFSLLFGVVIQIPCKIYSAETPCKLWERVHLL